MKEIKENKYNNKAIVVNSANNIYLKQLYNYLSSQKNKIPDKYIIIWKLKIYLFK